MPFQPVEATALIELVQSLDGQIIENTLYFRRASDYDAAGLETLAGTIGGWWIDQMAPLLCNAVSLNQVKATALHDQTGPQFISTVGLPAPGEVSADAVPNNSAFCISFRTALIGRSFRGRNFISGLPDTQIVLSRLAGGYANALVAAYGTIQDLLPVGTSWVVVTRTVNKVLQEVGLTNPITAVVIQDLVMDSQRRRLPGRGI